MFFLGDRLSGLIDFYFACNDALAYDIAVSLNAWCFEKDMSFNITKGQAFLRGYEEVRPHHPGGARGDADAGPRRGVALPADARLRLAEHPKDALVSPKIRIEYVRRLRFHQGVRSIAEYGLSEAANERARILSSSTRTAPAREIPGPGGWGAILTYGDTLQGDLRRRGRDHQQPHGADGGDLGARSAEARLAASSCTPTAST